jgi:hypothetical protein
MNKKLAKEPVPGQVKTRLYLCFLQDMMTEMSALEGIELAIAYTPGHQVRPLPPSL